ncbi:MAG TPA: sigma-70 family RNA polymerase sigma factor [Rhodocyclaceae bacterium]|jgi:RNA polymerase sigma-70 factor (ECF subfamily)|nr:sigma-70 family RNA polymerase sigma factor [Rhodocyclaceae bacterium]
MSSDVRLDEAGRCMTACLSSLRRYAHALIRDRGVADDLVQDTLDRAWTRIASWQAGSDMRPWLFSIMHNLHVDQLRRHAPVTVPLDDEALAVSVRGTHHDHLELRDLDAALRRLPDEQREVLLLIALEEMSYAEAASVLGISPGNVASRLSRAREKLRTVLEEQRKTSLKVVR